jgi:hypothetical protein
MSDLHENESEAEGFKDTSDEGENQLDDQTDYKDYDFPCGY